LSSYFPCLYANEFYTDAIFSSVLVNDYLFKQGCVMQVLHFLSFGGTDLTQTGDPPKCFATKS
jgi:hypothetical protein